MTSTATNAGAGGTPSPVSPPVPSPDDAFFWEGARRGELLLQRCTDCGSLRQPPVPMCPVCHSLRWDPQPASGRGKIYSWILSHHPNRPDEAPRVVVLVDLAEGVRLVSNLLVDDPVQITVGMPVEVTFVDHGEVVLPQFVPAASGAQAPGDR